MALSVVLRSIRAQEPEASFASSQDLSCSVQKCGCSVTAGSTRRVGRRREMVQPGRAKREVALLGHARGHPRCPQVGLARCDRVTRTFEQVRTHGLEAVRVRHPVVPVARPEQANPPPPPVPPAPAPPPPHPDPPSPPPP